MLHTNLLDTIVAPITGHVPAAVAIVRLSGPESWSIASRLFARWPKTPQSHHAIYGRLSTGDDGLALPFTEGHSYTGEQSVEFSIHGSLASVDALVNRVIDEGARMAAPGEFTLRAFLNGRIDLTQAEGVRDTVEALTEAQLRQANLLRDGALSRTVRQLRESLVAMLAAVEASVDFSEEIGPFDRDRAKAALEEIESEVDSLLETAGIGRILREGLRIAIVGLPNAGKSSLLNALLNSDRSIVTEIPGTTRDFVEEKIDLGGVPCVLIDTAGLRETEDPVEKIGVQRALAVADSADFVWFLHDVTQEWGKAECEFLNRFFGRRLTVVVTKSDLLPAEKRSKGSSVDSSEYSIGAVSVRPREPRDPGQSTAIRPMSISSETREGLPALITSVLNAVGLPVTNHNEASCLHDPEPRIHQPTPSATVAINSRHEADLVAARSAIESIQAALANDLPDDLLSVGLAEAIRCLGQITGETASPDIIDRIFHDFCIGK